MKEIKGFEKLYAVTKDGRVYSLITTSSRRKGLLKTYKDGGYLKVNLYDKNGKCSKKFVHRLVAQTYLNNPSRLQIVNHLDGDKENNSIENLEWTTQKKNINHSFIHGLEHRSVATQIDNTIYPNMKIASLTIGFKSFRIAYERRKRGNEFYLGKHSIKCGDAIVQH
ncbi:HNH endonuclease [Companilactobacillus kimchii]|uniref:HNH nuclease domain-containing protein n=2 Tax=Companilactobacillus kimchii TaxID=2801452 RepID=A0ABR5NW17_9LACO|nr:HNH endonuclease [Companilactobacillus kimchii]KAE9561311.1 hypothetical protein ATN91_07695 [Companilactobacillus kimchii]KRK53107.1 hypothetical protein FC97_GL001571 [Companilactobacillus kimchii DSM 13961 = JCM 10707]OWF32844.1 putative HNH endonuclease [Companilactobacillus kimchii]GEO48491.1 endonuclease [Companilactobacillus paralimentarius]